MAINNLTLSINDTAIDPYNHRTVSTVVLKKKTKAKTTNQIPFRLVLDPQQSKFPPKDSKLLWKDEEGRGPQSAHCGGRCWLCGAFLRTLINLHLKPVHLYVHCASKDCVRMGRQAQGRALPAAVAPCGKWGGLGESAGAPFPAPPAPLEPLQLVLFGDIKESSLFEINNMQILKSSNILYWSPSD